MNKKISILSINLLSGPTGSAKIATQISDSIANSVNKGFSLVGYCKTKLDNESALYSAPPMSLQYYFWVALNFFFEIFTPRHFSYKSLQDCSEYLQAKILHFHTIQGGYFDYRDLPLISKEKKIVWTLHDDWFCAGNDVDNLYFPYKTQSSFHKRKTIFEQTDMHLVAVSDWIYQKALHSNMFPKDHIHLIRNGIDTSIFFPRDKSESRKTLGIASDVTMVVSIAGAGRKSKAKGIQYVERLAQEMSSDSSVQFFSLGNRNAGLNNNIHEVEFVSPEMMALYFSAADIFLYPTRADSFGLVIAESIACGCPVITFDIGATSELVQEGKTGFIVPLGDYESLRKSFIDLQNNPIRITPSALPFDISLTRMIQEYTDLYDQVLSR